MVMKHLGWARKVIWLQIEESKVNCARNSCNGFLLGGLGGFRAVVGNILLNSFVTNL